jgi:hypothetical protein
MSESSNNLEIVQANTRNIQKAVFSSQEPSPFGSSPPNGSGSNGVSALDQSTARTVQSVGQTTAIVIQDAGDMLRNISTIETTAIAAATSAWIASEGLDIAFEAIIDKGMSIMNDAAALYLKIGQNAYQVLSQFKAPPS